MFVLLLCWCFAAATAAEAGSAATTKLERQNTEISENLYPSSEKRKTISEFATFFIDPAKGDDTLDGLTEKTAWRSFRPLNQFLFKAGGTVKVIAPGQLTATLMPMTEKNSPKPLAIRFAPGRYDIMRQCLIKRKLNISNTNDDPAGLKAIAIYIKDSCNIRLEGKNTELFMCGKMIDVCVDHSRNISFKGLSFDYNRPTVSEYTVRNIGDNFADIAVHHDSTYKIRGGILFWEGEDWEYKAGRYGQVLDLATNVLRRKKSPFSHVVKVEELKPFLLRAYWENKNPGFQKGVVYQSRDIRRDCAGVFQRRSFDISWEKCNFYFLHGMCVVSQFCENLTFNHVNWAPRPGSGRTCSGWADLLHCSGCAGQINVFNVRFSGANDDAINVHGAHLRIMERVSDKQIKIRYMHHQTFGFAPCRAGDEIDFVRADTMLPYASNRVENVEQLSPKEFLLTLTDNAPINIHKSDVVENTTWTPALHVKNCVVDRIPTRGFLITTRKKVVVENTLFLSPTTGILCEDDAQGWYESGVIRDMTVRNCVFLNCGIAFNPSATKSGNYGVHRNIVIKNNTFYSDAPTVISAKHTENIAVSDNTIYTTKRGKDGKSADSAISFSASINAKAIGNKYKFITKFPSDTDLSKTLDF